MRCRYTDGWVKTDPKYLLENINGRDANWGIKLQNKWQFSLSIRVSVREVWEVGGIVCIEDNVRCEPRDKYTMADVKRQIADSNWRSLVVIQKADKLRGIEKLNQNNYKWFKRKSVWQANGEKSGIYIWRESR